MSMHGVVAEFEEEQTPVMPLMDPDAELALVKRQRRFGKFVPRWFLTLIGTKLSLLGTIILVLVILAAICAPLLTSIDPTAMTSPMSIGPSPGHPFGTNSAGQDIYSQTLYGARFSLAVGVMTGIAITVIAIVVGMIAGYIGGWIDDFLSMVMNIFLIIPQLPLLIVIGAYIPLSNDQTVAIALRMTAILTFTGWAWGARVMRAQTLSLRSRDFVDAAVVNGESKMHIIFRDILPNMLGPDGQYRDPLHHGRYLDRERPRLPRPRRPVSGDVGHDAEFCQCSEVFCLTVSGGASCSPAAPSP